MNAIFLSISLSIQTFRKKTLSYILYILDCRSQRLPGSDVTVSTYALPEKTKRGPPTNKNISVKNMKAQITNMSLNENAGFKSEYHVRLFSFI